MIFVQKAGSCKYNPKHSLTTLSGYVDLPQGDEEALTAAIAQIGPISVWLYYSRLYTLVCALP